jgi:hypothetical protein
MSFERTGAIVVYWSSPYAGRETQLFAVLGKVIEYGEKLRAAGRIESVRIFVTKAGAYRDTLMLSGPLDDLTKILTEREFEGLLLEGSLVVQKISIDVWEGGSPEWLLSGPNAYAETLQLHGIG